MAAVLLSGNDAAGPIDNTPVEEESTDLTYEPSDERFIDAMIEQESRGQSRAVSPKGAQGLMQLMPETGAEEARKLGKELGREIEYDPFDPVQNRTLGTRYIKKQYEDFKDKKSALAAYNAGPERVRGLQEKYGPNYDDYSAHLPEETRKYVPEVLARYEKKAGAKKSVAVTPPDAAAPVAKRKGVGSVEDFANEWYPIVSDPGFSRLPFKDRIAKLGSIFHSGKWDMEAWEAMKQVADFNWDAASPDELPDIGSFVGAPPILKKDQKPGEALPAWKTQVEQNLIESGINPLFFGKRLDSYLDQAIHNETQAYEYRNRGAVAQAAYRSGQVTRDVITGVASPLVDAGAFVGRSLDTIVNNAPDKGVGQWVSDLPQTLLGKPSRDWEYEVDENGYLKKGKDGLPIHRSVGEVIRGVSGLATFLIAPAGALKLGVSSLKVATTMGGVGTLMGMENAYKETLGEGGTPQQGMEAAMLAAPTSALAALGSYAVVVGGPPGVLGLSHYNKAKVLAPYMLRSGAIEAGISTAQQASQSGIVGEVIGRNVQTPRKLGEAALIGAVGGAAGTGIHGLTQPYRPTVRPGRAPSGESDFTVGGDEPPPPGQLALPAPPERPGLPAPPQRAAIEGPSTETRQLPGKLYRTGADPVIRVSQPVDVDVRAELGVKLQDFQRSEASHLEVTADQAKKLDPEVLSALHMDVVPVEGGGFMVQKRVSYTPVEGGTLEQINKNIDALRKDLENSPSDGAVPELLEERKVLRRQIKEKENSWAKGMVEVYKNRRNLQKEIDARKSEYESQKDPTLRKVSKLELIDSENKLRDFDTAHEDFYNAFKSMNELQDRFELITRQVKGALDPSKPYLNNVKAKERNLVELYQKRSELLDREKTREQKQLEDTEAAVKENLTQAGLDSVVPPQPEKGINVEGFTVLPHKGKWYVMSPKGDIIGKAFDYYYDAVHDGVTAGKDLESLKYVPVPQRTRLSAQDEAAISSQVRSEKEATQKNLEEARREAEKHRETVYKSETKAAQKLSEKERKAREKAQKKKGIVVEKTSTVTAEMAGEPVEGGSPREETQPGVSEERLQQSALSAERLYRYDPRKPLTSDYVTDPRKVYTGKGETQISARKIFGDLQKFLGTLDKNLKIFRGGRLPKDTLGFLNSLKNYIKVGRFDNVSTAVHEMAHAVDSHLIGKWDEMGVPDYSSVPTKVLEAAKDMADTYYRREIPDDLTKIKEGFSLFFQQYMTGNPVREEMLDWYHSSFKDQNPEAYAFLEKAGQQVFNYYNQSPSKFTQSEIVPVREEKRAMLRDALSSSRFMDNWVDSATVLKDYDKAANSKTYGLYHAVKGKAQSIANKLLYEGLVDEQGFKVPGLSLEAALAPAKGKYDLLNAYLVAKRRLHWLTPQNIEGGGNLKDNIGTIADIEQNHPEVAKAANNYYDFLTYLDRYEASLGSGTAQKIAQQRKTNLEISGAEHGYYVPFARSGKGLGFSPGKKMTGSTRPIVDPLSNISRVVENRLAKGYESQVKELIMDAATSNAPSSAGLFVREVTGGQRTGELTKELKSQMKQLGEETDSPTGHFTNEEMAFWSKPMPGSTDNVKVLTYHDGTKLRFFEVDQRISRLFNEVLPDIVNNPVFKWFYRAPAVLQRAGASSFRMSFQLRNAIRDPFSVLRYHLADVNNPKDALQLGKAFMDSYIDQILYTTGVGREKRLANRISNLGIGNATRVGAQQEILRQIRKDFKGNVVDLADGTLGKLEAALSVPEQAVRQASLRYKAYKMGIKDLNAPLSPTELIDLVTAYKEGSTNFGKQGYQARVVNMGTTFFTARINEIARLKSDFERSPVKMSVLAAAMLGYGIKHALQYMNEDWYKEMSGSSIMEDVWHTVDVNGVQKAIRIPLDTYSGAAFGAGQIIGRMIYGDKQVEEDFWKNITDYAARFSPINSIADPGGVIVKELYQQGANVDLFSGRAIVPPSLQYRDPREQYTQYTTSLAKSIGNLMNWSPLQVEHAMRSAFPAGVEYSRLFDVESGKVKAAEEEKLSSLSLAERFIIRSFARAGTAEGIMDRSHNEFVDHLNAFRANRSVEDPLEAEQRKKLEKINRQVSDLSAFMYGVEDTASRNELRAKKRELLRQGNRIAKGAPEAVRKAPLIKKLADKVREATQLEKGKERAARESGKFDLLGE